MDEDEATPTAEQGAALTAAATGIRRVQGVLCVEGVQTGDGRIMREGSLTWVDPPLPLAWLEEQMHGDLLEGGEQIGTIDAILRNGTTIAWMGGIDTGIPAGAECVRRMEAGSAPAGHRFGVSIDPDDWAVELIDTEGDMADMILMVASGHGPLPTSFTIPHTAPVAAAAGEPEPDGTVIMEDSADTLIAAYTRLRIRGATLCAIQAIDNAYCELAPMAATTASATPDTPAAEAECYECGEHAAIVEGLTAAAGGEPTPRVAPAAWYSNPGFTRDDPRLVRQPDGRFLCPMTVTDDGHVFGHMAGWFSCHTGYTDSCVPPPRSRTNYAAFNDRPIETSDGQLVRVGQITMGCGHADADRPMSPKAVKAHYDGGPGAVAVCDVVAGEDEFGIWFSGAIRQGITDDQLRAFRACGVSGDWREVWRGQGLDLLACLAGVNAPGFPIAAAAMVAAAEQGGASVVSFAPRARYEEGRIVALVAAGSVPQLMPWDRTIANQQQQIDTLTETVRRLETAVAPLRPLAAAAMFDTLTLPPPPAPPAPEPTALERRLTAAATAET